MVEFEYWWLLGLPLFFGLGWIAARIDIKQIVTESRALPRSYFKGLNFLLNEQPDKAIEAFIEVVNVDPRELAQYYCELATSEAAQSRPDAARRHLEAALEANRKCVRASLQLGDLERSSKNLEKAIEQWKRIESQNPAYLALAAQRLFETHREAGRAEEGLHLLAGYLERYPSLDLLDTVFQHTLEAKGHEEAYRLVRDELRRNPTLLGLDRLLEAQIIAAGSPDPRPDLELVRNLVPGHTRRPPAHPCGPWGFKARQFYWRYPACGGWETYPPRRTEGFELTP